MQPPDKFLAVLLGSLTFLSETLPVVLASHETMTTTSTADFDRAGGYGAPPVCKPGFEVPTIQLCEEAASQLNAEFSGTEYDQAYPSGCYKYIDNRVYFNFDSGFDAAPGCSRICLAGGAPQGTVSLADMAQRSNAVWNVTGDENVMTLVGEMGHKFALFEADGAGRRRNFYYYLMMFVSKLIAIFNIFTSLYLHHFEFRKNYYHRTPIIHQLR